MDVIAAKHNLTEVTNMAKGFLDGIAHRGTALGVGEIGIRNAKVSNGTMSYRETFVEYFRIMKAR